MVLLAVALPVGAAAQRPPDIVLVNADDMRADQLPYMPRTMAIAAEGVRFTRAFVHVPLCSPNRASLLTGLYAHSHQIICNDGAAARFHASYGLQHLGTWLPADQYYKCAIGKWMNGVEPAAMPFWPYVAAGWDEWHVFVGQGGYTDYKLIQKTGNGPASVTRYTEYSTTKLARLVRQCIERAPADKAVFVFFNPKTNHAPHVMEFDADKKHGAPFPMSAAFNEDPVDDKPSFIQQLPLLSSTEITAAQNAYKKQVGQLQSLDRAADDIQATLVAVGRWATTTWLQTSDNGQLVGEHRLLDGKSCAYDPCVRIPLFVRVPGGTPRVDTDHLVSTLDLTSTIVAIAGVTPPWQLDGRDLLPLIADPTIAWRTDLLIELLQEDNHRPPFTMIVADDGDEGGLDVYVAYDHGEREYYPPTDPTQLQNAVTDPAYASRVAALQQRLAVLAGQWVIHQ